MVSNFTLRSDRKNSLISNFLGTNRFCFFSNLITFLDFVTFIYVVIKSIDGNSRFLWKISASNPSGRAVRLQPLRDQMTRQWPRPVRRFCSFREASDHKNHREVHEDGGQHIKFRSHWLENLGHSTENHEIDMSNWDDIQAFLMPDIAIENLGPKMAKSDWETCSSLPGGPQKT